MLIFPVSHCVSAGEHHKGGPCKRWLTQPNFATRSPEKLSGVLPPVSSVSNSPCTTLVMLKCNLTCPSVECLTLSLLMMGKNEMQGGGGNVISTCSTYFPSQKEIQSWLCAKAGSISLKANFRYIQQHKNRGTELQAQDVVSILQKRYYLRRLKYCRNTNLSKCAEEGLAELPPAACVVYTCAEMLN